MKPITNPDVLKVFESYPETYGLPLLKLRQLIFDVAETIPEVGELEESLKWNQPSYSTTKTKSGTPVRLDRFGSDKIALFVNCQTTLIEEFKLLFSDILTFSNNRAIVLDPQEELPVKELTFCIEAALTYHRHKKSTK